MIWYRYGIGGDPIDFSTGLSHAGDAEDELININWWAERERERDISYRGFINRDKLYVMISYAYLKEKTRRDYKGFHSFKKRVILSRTSRHEFPPSTRMSQIVKKRSRNPWGGSQKSIRWSSHATCNPPVTHRHRIYTSQQRINIHTPFPPHTRVF